MTTRKIERTPTPTTNSSPSTPAPQPASVDKSLTPTAQPSSEAAAKRSPKSLKRLRGLAYETTESMLQCRMCLAEAVVCSVVIEREVDPTTRVVAFPLSAAYTELVGPCGQEHDAALEALACMSPGAITEMRQRFQAAR
ncbi:hypothetical protein V8E53_013116 [Lactarius tabidus]